MKSELRFLSITLSEYDCSALPTPVVRFHRSPSSCDQREKVSPKKPDSMLEISMR
jgi:hypothetical protein